MRGLVGLAKSDSHVVEPTIPNFSWSISLPFYATWILKAVQDRQRIFCESLLEEQTRDYFFMNFSRGYGAPTCRCATGIETFNTGIRYQEIPSSLRCNEMPLYGQTFRRASLQQSRIADPRFSSRLKAYLHMQNNNQHGALMPNSRLEDHQSLRNCSSLVCFGRKTRHHGPL
jgi:hypothetical protein